jgi:photosystem II stability/assembly factor-like uncharacterized protein
LALDFGLILVGTDDGLYLSLNGGNHFSPIPIGHTGTTYTVWSIQRVGALGENLVLSAQEDPPGGGPGSVWFSSDFGWTWEQADVDVSDIPQPNTPRRMTVATSLASCCAAWAMLEVPGSQQPLAAGLLVSDDFGHHWRFKRDAEDPPVLFAANPDTLRGNRQGWYNQLLIVDPTNPDRIYVGASTSGVFRTLDGGDTWLQLNTDGNGEGGPLAYAHPDYHTAAFADWGQLELLVGSDGGLSVFHRPSQLQPPLRDDPAFLDLRHNRGLATNLVTAVGSTTANYPDHSPFRIVMGLQDEGSYVRQPENGSLEGSGTFVDERGSDGFGARIHPANGDRMVASRQNGVIWYTDNGGGAWFNSSVPNDPSGFPVNTKLVFGMAQDGDEPGSTLYTHGNSIVFKSADFGRHFFAVPMNGVDLHYGIRNVAGSASNPDAIALVTRVPPGSLGWVTYDGGGNWSPFGDLPNSGTTLYAVWFDTHDDQVLYAAATELWMSESHLWKSTNGGSTWTRIDVGPEGEDNGFPFGIPVYVIQSDPTESRTLYAGTDFGVYASLDAGGTWAPLGEPGLPRAAVWDLYVAPDGSLVRAGTMGRGVWELARGE